MDQEKITNTQKMKELLDNCKSHNFIIPDEFSTFDFTLFQYYPHIFKLTLSQNFTRLIDALCFNGSCIEEIVVNEKVSYIDQLFFNKQFYNSMPHLIIDKNNPYYSQKEGAIYDLRGHTLMFIDPTYKGSCTLLEDTKYMDCQVFANCSLSSIIIPNDIDLTEATNNSLWNYPLFTNCNNLTRLEIHNKEAILELSWFISAGRQNQDYKVLKRIAKYLYPSNFRMDAKHVIIHEIVDEIVNGTTMKDDAKKEWLSFIKKSHRSFYQDIVDDELFLDLCLQGRYLSLFDVQNLIALAIDKNNIDLNTKLLEYQHTNFTEKEIQKELEKRLSKKMKV